LSYITTLCVKFCSNFDSYRGLTAIKQNESVFSLEKASIYKARIPE